MLELYCDRLSKESVVWRDVREGVKGDVRAEVGEVSSVLKSGLVQFLDPNEAQPQPQPQPVWTAHPYSGNQTKPPTTGLQQSICGLATGLDWVSW